MESFRLWLGAEDNNVRVFDVDSKQQQLLLLVKEPKRKFKRRATKYGIIRMTCPPDIDTGEMLEFSWMKGEGYGQETIHS